MAALNVDVRRARKFLFDHNLGHISPRRFATAASELGLTFSKLLAMIMRMRGGGQGEGQAPIATRVAMKEAA